MGHRPIWEVKGIFFLRFAEKNIKIEALCSSILIGWTAPVLCIQKTMASRVGWGGLSVVDGFKGRKAGRYEE